jgi:hypothetical protein
LSAFASLSEVPTLSVEFIILSATNCNCLGIINFIPLKATIRPLSSTKPAILIKASSRDVSLRSAAVTGGDGKELCATDHPLTNGATFANEPSTAADLNETSLEDALISISTFVDERNMIIALRGMKLIVPPQLQFIADRLLESTLRPGTSDNDVNANRNMGMVPDGYTVNHFLTDTDAFFIKTDAPNGFKLFERSPQTI